ncbi:hypothetical protein ACF0H5_000200 [Mactra antiquata]
MSKQLGYFIFVIVTFIGCAEAGTPTYTLLGNASAGYMMVAEDFQVNRTLFSVHASDSDFGDVLNIESTDGVTREYFKAEPQSTGTDGTFEIKLIKELDYEMTTSMTVKLTLIDKQQNRIRIKVSLYLTDVNDNHPVFNQQPYTWEIHEQPCNITGPWNTFKIIQANDADSGQNGRVTYSMEPKSEYNETKTLYNSKFQIDPATGHVTQKQCVDYETNSYYQFIVTAKDGGPNGGLNSTVDFIIRVKDDQDTPPFFTRDSFRVRIPEDKPVGSVIATVHAKDGDRGVSQKVNYTAVSDCGDIFDISASSGEIKTTKELDRDKGVIFNNSGECIINITATEIKTYPNQYNTTQTNTTVTISVSDVNDNTPNFTEGSTVATVKENSPTEVPVMFNTTLHVVDSDQGNNADMDISILCSNSTTGCSTFKVTPTIIHGSGDIIVQVLNETLLDYETREIINITVIATEKANKSHIATFDVLVEIIDVNDNGPKFNTTSTMLSLTENSDNGTSVGNITATDADISPEFKKLTYSIVGGNDKFTVNKSTGEIFTICNVACNITFDREIQDTYFMTYTATDPGMRRDSMSIEVRLSDENDNQPVFSRKTYLVYKQENDTNLNLVNVKASDKDKTGTNNSEFYFKVCNSTDNYFTSNNSLSFDSEGWLKLSSPIDYESLSSQSKQSGLVNVSIKVVDNGTPSLSSDAMVQLTIQDINDKSPVFQSPHYNYSILENSTTKDIDNAMEVGNVSASDDDGTTRNSEINYFIQEGGADRFDIGYNTGMVTVRMNARFDRETQKNYNLTILATDQGSPPNSATVMMFIDIKDVNDEYPKFDHPDYAISVKENATLNTTFISCRAHDQDLNNNLNYSILNVSATNEDGKSVNKTLIEDYFGINSTTGDVFVANELDRETAKTVVITLLVEDVAAFCPKPQNDTATLTITLKDINDHAPEFSETIYNTRVIENAVNGTLLIQTLASDVDENRTVTYRLDDSTGKFTINKVTGWISKLGELDRETEPNISLVVIATDNGVPKKSSNVTVNVTIDDFNDNPPTFITSNKSIDVWENVTTGYSVIHIRATDKDIGPNANITFTLQDNDPATNYFDIDPITGNITVNESLDRETINEFNLLIIAKDNPEDEKVQKTAQESITVNILDVNDNAPKFSKEIYTADVVENAENLSVVTQVSAKDNDTGKNAQLTYKMKCENCLFEIDVNDGTIRVNSSLVEKVGNYPLEVIALDSGEPSKNGSTIVNITVLDVNLNYPVITHLPEHNEIKVFECVRLNTIIHNFNYTDKDFGQNGKAEFNMSKFSVDVSSVFNLMPNGSLQVKAKLSVNNATQYKFQIQAIDCGTPRLTSNKETITVTILDVNDHSPSFNTKHKAFTVKENMTSNQSVYQVKAYDKDTNSTSCYEFDPATQHNFIIERYSGKIFYNKSIDYEVNKTITFTVTVADCSQEMPVVDYCEKNGTIKIAQVNEDVNKTLEITVNVLDIDDNPPVFSSKTLSTGMRRNTEPGTVLSLNLRNSTMIDDADTPSNGVLSWKFSNYGNITTSSNLQDKISTISGTDTCEDGFKHIFCMTTNGTIVNNKYFSEDLIGYFIVPIKVWDNGGSDLANLTIYLIADSQILTMNIRHDKETVSQHKEEILSRLSDILGPYTAVFDNLQDHKENDVVVRSSSDIHFHIVRSDTKEVMAGDEAVRLLDEATSTTAMLSFKNEYNIMTVSKQQTSTNKEEDSSNRTFYILVAVSVSEALIISLVVYVSLATKSKYQRKLKAASIKPDIEMNKVEQEMVVIPGSNVYAKQYNPLLNAQIEENQYDNIIPEDSDSMDNDINLDENEVDDPNTVYDRMEEREATLDMYTDDSRNSISSEDLLDSALKYHQTQKSTEVLNEIEDDYAGENRNYAYDEDYESTEI